MVTTKKKTKTPKVTTKNDVSVQTERVKKGNHLTVTISPSGVVKLEWDWDALLKEIVEATGNPVKSKSKKIKE